MNLKSPGNETIPDSIFLIQSIFQLYELDNEK